LVFSILPIALDIHLFFPIAENYQAFWTLSANQDVLATKKDLTFS
jgi:hypothetical protein